MHMPRAGYPNVQQLQALIEMHPLRALQACSHNSSAVLVLK